MFDLILVPRADLERCVAEQPTADQESVGGTVQAVREVALALWEQGRPPTGLHWQRRNKLINDELGKTGRSASDSSIQRAFRDWPSADGN